MIKALVTDFFNEIEKKELKKNKNAQAIFWVEELQEVTSIDKNYISVKKATRLYNKYVEEKENVIVKEPNKYLLDFMSLYLGYNSYEKYKSSKTLNKEIFKPEKKAIYKKIEVEKTSLRKYKNYIIGVLVLLIFPVFFFINKYTNSNTETCIIWTENHFEKSSCASKTAIDNSIFNIDIENFEKIEVTEDTPFFIDGNPKVWYGKSATGKIEFFSNRGIHPATLKELAPITEYMLKKYVYSEGFLN
ncbi:hypothetical protein CW731_15295 [Polaribacter sp. ALD11]|nr:hypothetical protein CW731_15295 [Polaribacter sp. ALD11]